METVKPTLPQQVHTQNGVQVSSSWSWSVWSAVCSILSLSQLASSEHGNTESTITKSDNMRAEMRTDKSTFRIKEIQNLLKIIGLMQWCCRWGIITVIKK
jgi:hypothetical protein